MPPISLPRSELDAWEAALAELDGRPSEDEQARRDLLVQCPTAVDLAARFDPTYKRTSALNLLGQRLSATALSHDGRLAISIPPQEGKTSCLRWLCAWLLLDNPDRRIVYASYAATLARASGRIVRSYIQAYGAAYGLTIARDHADASDWQLESHRGGVVTVGVGGALTGRPADILIVDDPLRNRQDADSVTVRGNLHDWWSSVARTRLAPGAPVVIVQTRWHEDDLAGRMESQGWPVVNIPALADGKTPDALHRPAGTWLVSARGRTDADWQNTRRDVGEREFAALYQGRPAPLEGGVFKRDWFAMWRIAQAPPDCLPPTVIVDPADNEGDGDEAGIILATKHPGSGKAYILDDLSAPMTVARWARVALLTCVRREAPVLAFEKSLSQLPSRIRAVWQQVFQQALALHRSKGDLDSATARLVRPDDPADARESVAADLTEIAADVNSIIRFGEVGPFLEPITATGTKQLRMQLAAPMFETGRAVMVGTHRQLEHQAATWQVGQDSPDRVDAMVHAVTLLTDRLEPQFLIDRDEAGEPKLAGMPEQLPQPLGPRIAVLPNPDGSQWMPADPQRGRVVIADSAGGWYR